MPVAHRTFTTPDGLTHAYYELAVGNDGPPVILQHGFSATTIDEWVEPGIAAAIGTLGRRVIGLDALGRAWPPTYRRSRPISASPDSI